MARCHVAAVPQLRLFPAGQPPSPLAQHTTDDRHSRPSRNGYVFLLLCADPTLIFCSCAATADELARVCATGKSQLAQRLVAELGTDGYAVRVVVLDIDDLVYPDPVIGQLSSRDPSNKLFKGRGMPGTYDLALGERILSNMRGEPQPAPLPTDPPVDDSLYVQNEERAIFPTIPPGESERSSTRVITEPRKVDVFLVVGWCLGLAPLGPHRVAARYREAKEKAASEPDKPPPSMLMHKVEHLQAVDEVLAQMARRWVSRLDAFVQLWPVVGVRTAVQEGDLMRAKFSAWDMIYDWRHASHDASHEADCPSLVFEMPVYEMWASTGRLAKLAPYSPVGPGSNGEGDPWLKSLHAQESSSRPTDVPSDDETSTSELPHALPQRIIRIDFDRRRSVQHFTLI